MTGRPADEREPDDPFSLGGPTEMRVGRMRKPTSSEAAQVETLLRADAVLRLVREVPEEAALVEKHVASLLDGARPVARVRARSGLGLEDLRTALAMLLNRRAVSLVGIIEFVDDDGGVGGGEADVIAPHVMHEIQAMIEEEEKNRALDDGSGEFGNDTTEMPLPASTASRDE